MLSSQPTQIGSRCKRVCRRGRATLWFRSCPSGRAGRGPYRTRCHPIARQQRDAALLGDSGLCQSWSFCSSSSPLVQRHRELVHAGFAWRPVIRFRKHFVNQVIPIKEMLTAFVKSIEINLRSQPVARGRASHVDCVGLRPVLPGTIDLSKDVEVAPAKWHFTQVDDFIVYGFHFGLSVVCVLTIYSQV